jgi:hypothetical protein
MESIYSVWMGQPVILRVAYGAMRVLFRGKLVGEAPELLRLHTADGLDVEIFKSRVLAIEEDLLDSPRPGKRQRVARASAVRSTGCAHIAAYQLADIGISGVAGNISDLFATASSP